MAFEVGELVYKLKIDRAQFERDMAGASESFKGFGDKAKQTGDTLSKFLTIPILALGTATIKMAADAEVSGRKFAKAFQGAEAEAAAAVQKLTDTYAMSTGEAKRLLAFTGDLLKGFGATSSQALQTSLSVQELAASLSAYNGVPVAQASEAITKALIGETDGLKMLGVAVNQEMIMEELARQGKDKLTGQALKLAQAEAVLKLSYTQSADAVASFGENTNTASFKAKALMGQLKDLAVTFGADLLPTFKDAIAIAADVLKGMQGMDEGQRKLIITVATLAAASGPLVKGIGLISSALSLVAAHPVIAAVALIAAGFALLLTNVKTYRQVTAELNSKTDALKVTSDKLAETNKQLASATDTLTAAQRRRLEIERDLLSEQAKSQVRDLLASYVQWSQHATAVNAKIAQTSARLKENQDFLIENGELSVEGAAAYQRSIDRDTAALSALRAEQAGMNNVLEATVDSLAASVVAGTADLRQIMAINVGLGSLVTRRVEEIRATGGATEATDQNTGSVKKNTEAMTQGVIAGSAYADMMKDIGDILENSKSEYEKIREEIAKLERFRGQNAEDEKRRLQALAILRRQQNQIEIQETISKLETIANFYGQFQGAILSIFSNIAQAAQQQVDAQLSAQEATLDAEAQARIDALDKATMTEEEYAAARENIEAELQTKKTQLEKDAAKRKWEVEVAMFNAKKAADIISTTINTTVAVVKTLAELGFTPWGIAAAAAMTILGGLQVAAIASQPSPPPPQLAEGGLVMARAGGLNAVIGEGASDEVVLPLNDKVFERLAAGITAMNTARMVSAATGGLPATVIINLDGKQIAASTVELVNDRQYMIDARSVR